MLVKRFGYAAMGLVMGLAALGGCASKYSADDLKRELTTGTDALTQDQANCIVDGLSAKGVPLDKYKDPKADDQKKIDETVTDCALKSVNQSVPSTLP